MAKFDVSTATDAELEAENQRLMAERGEAERSFKAQQQAIQAELDGRAIVARLDGLTDEQRVAILDIVKGA